MEESCILTYKKPQKLRLLKSNIPPSQVKSTFLCYLIVANQYIHLLFPDLFLRANCLYLSNNNFFLPSYQKHWLNYLAFNLNFFLQQFFINNLVVCPMYIQGFSVNHKFRHLGKVFRNFPVHVISRKSRYRLSQPGFDHYYTWFSKVISFTDNL